MPDINLWTVAIREPEAAYREQPYLMLDGTPPAWRDRRGAQWAALAWSLNGGGRFFRAVPLVRA